jgi:hypothetical protein
MLTLLLIFPWAIGGNDESFASSSAPLEPSAVRPHSRKSLSMSPNSDIHHMFEFHVWGMAKCARLNSARTSPDIIEKDCETSLLWLHISHQNSRHRKVWEASDNRAGRGRERVELWEHTEVGEGVDINGMPILLTGWYDGALTGRSPLADRWENPTLLRVTQAVSACPQPGRHPSRNDTQSLYTLFN